MSIKKFLRKLFTEEFKNYKAYRKDYEYVKNIIENSTYEDEVSCKNLANNLFEKYIDEVRDTSYEDCLWIDYNILLEIIEERYEEVQE